MKRSVCLLFRSLSTSSAPPIRVDFTPDAGRGVFAIRNIGVGEVIHTAEPLVAHPTLQNVTKVCYHCLRRLGHVNCTYSSHVTGLSDANQHIDLDNNSDRHKVMQIKFCSKKCAESAEAFYAIERRANWETFHRFCSEESLRLPLLAKRLICMVTSGMVQKDGLDILSHTSVPNETASCWMLTRKMVLAALMDSGIPEEKLAFASAEWYVGVLARMSSNAFRVELLVEESTNLLAAAFASVSGEGICGNAVYILPSMYNHDCDPNVHISWPQNTTAKLTSRRDIEKGEELRITYLDASMSRLSRQKLLQQAYHFECNCARCRDEE